MNKISNNKTHFSFAYKYIFVFAIIFLNSCYIEKKLGKEFVANAPKTSLLILDPDLVLKSDIRNDSTDTSIVSETFNSLEEGTVSDIYLNELKRKLMDYGIKVFTSNRIDTFFTLSPPAYLINIAQLEIEAFYYPFSEHLTTDSLIYTQNFLLNGFNFNSWFEFSELNSDKKAEVLFSNFFIKDEISGDFKMNLFTEDVNYEYNRKNLSPEDIQSLIKYAGKTNGQYIFNHLLNNYIKEKTGNKFNEHYFYYYDPVKNKFLFLENYKEFKKIK